MNPLALTENQKDAVETLADHFANRKTDDRTQQAISATALNLASAIGAENFRAVMLETLKDQCRSIAGKCVGVNFLSAAGGKTGISGDQVKLIKALGKRLMREVVMPQILDMIPEIIPTGDFLESLLYTKATKAAAERRGLIGGNNDIDPERLIRRVNDRNVALDQLNAQSENSSDDEDSSSSSEIIDVEDFRERLVAEANGEELDDYEEEGIDDDEIPEPVASFSDSEVELVELADEEPTIAERLKRSKRQRKPSEEQVGYIEFYKHYKAGNQ